MSEIFTVEEVNLMCIFDTSSRENLVNGLSEAMTGFDDLELIEIAANVVAKANAISDEDFAALALYPVYDDDDESEG